MGMPLLLVKQMFVSIQGSGFNSLHPPTLILPCYALHIVGLIVQHSGPGWGLFVSQPNFIKIKIYVFLYLFLLSFHKQGCI